MKKVFLSRGGRPSHLIIWGTVVLSTEGAAPPGGPSASACLAHVSVCVCLCVHAHGVSLMCRVGGLLWALELFLPGAGSGHVMPLAGSGGAGRLQQEAGR